MSLKSTTPSIAPFVSNSTAPSWEDGMITGSGRVGALLFGPPEAHTVSLAHERFFLPANPTPAAPVISTALPSIREAVARGDGERAAPIMMEAARTSGFPDGVVWTNPLGICATLVVRTSSADAVDHMSRHIDLEHGEIATEWTPLDVCVCALWPPRDGETVWLSVEAEQRLTLDIELGLSLDDAPSAATGAPRYSGVVRSDLLPGRVGRLVASTGDGLNAVAATTTVSGPSGWNLDESASRAGVVGRLHDEWQRAERRHSEPHPDGHA